MLYALSQLMLLKEKSSRKLFLFQGIYAPNTDQIKCDNWGVIWKKSCYVYGWSTNPPLTYPPPPRNKAKGLLTIGFP